MPIRALPCGLLALGCLCLATDRLCAAGPDVVVTEIFDTTMFGRAGTFPNGTIGIGIATQACNWGDAPVEWFGLPDTNHPMISINMFRMKMREGSLRFEQIGQSWLKHGFAAAQEAFCAPVTCTPFMDMSQLGVGCGDTYLSHQIANPCDVGPRSMIHPFTGVMPAGGNLGAGGGCGGNFPSRNHIGHAHNGISHRLQVRDVDLLPGQNVGATYFSEGQYVAPHEFAAGNGNQNNNSSYIQVIVDPPTGGGFYNFTETGTIFPGEPAINAWPASAQTAIEPAPLIDGRATLAYSVTDLGAGLWHYEYVVYNLNLDRAVGSLSIPVPDGVTVSTIGFHAPLNHAPEPNYDNYSNDPWTVVESDGTVTWSTTPFASDPLANAVRFGTAYNFRFDANSPPQAVDATVGLFKTSDSVLAATLGPSPLVFIDCNNNTIDDRCDVSCALPGCDIPGCGQSSDCTPNGIPDECEPNCSGTGVPDRCKIAQGAIDADGDGVPDLCNIPEPQTAPAPHDRLKNRYLSFVPNGGGIPAAFRVDKLTAPTGNCWVSAPDANAESRCVASPVFRVWSELLIHVGDCEISPVASYEIRATVDGLVFSTPLSLQTIMLPSLNGKFWGDLVGNNNGVEWTPPNQFANVQDVLAVLAYITGAPIAPAFQQANLQSISTTDSCLNSVVNTADVLIDVRAVAGDVYPFNTDPSNCPVCP